MPDTQPENKPIDLTKVAAGTFSPHLLDGAPVDFVKDLMFRRAGIPADDSMRKDLEYTHPADRSLCPRLPENFPPDDWSKRTQSGNLSSVQDWLDLIGSVDTSPRLRADDALKAAEQAQRQQEEAAAKQGASSESLPPVQEAIAMGGPHDQ